MDSERPLLRDPSNAAMSIEALKEKDKDVSICRYPACYELRQASPGTGRPSAYCSNPDHTAVSNHRARQQLYALVNAKESKKQEQGGESTVESLRTSVIAHMSQLQSDMQRYIDTLKTLTDPDLSAARIAEAQQVASAERALRFAAESAVLAAQEDARTEREAAEAAIHQMEEAEVLLQRQRQETDQQIQDIQNQRDEIVAQIQGETQRQLAEMDEQVKVALAQAQEEIKHAQNRAREREILAQSQVQAAEQRVAETRENVERERSEVDRLRAELATVVTNARTERESERAEARANLERERAEARENVERERSEVDRLRAELAIERARADNLALLRSELQKQIVQITEKETQDSERQL